MNEAGTILRRVDFNRVKAALPVFRFNLLVIVTPETQARVATSITQLGAATDMTDRQRCIILGTYLMREVGPQVLAHAVDALGDSIAIEP